MNYWHAQWPGWISKFTEWKKNQYWKLHCRIAFKHSWNNKIRASEERIVFARMGKGQNQSEYIYKRAR